MLKGMQIYSVVVSVSVILTYLYVEKYFVLTCLYVEKDGQYTLSQFQYVSY